MKFRYARHTENLEKLTTFYTEIVGLERLGGFENHNGYNRTFLGIEGSDWHLEFTVSETKAQHKFDEDDALVFYMHSALELQSLKNQLIKNKIPIEKARNPYWNENGILFSDPDGHKIIFAYAPISLHTDSELGSLIIAKGINTWSEILDYIKKLPYGRNENRKDLNLVLKEDKGTCSSKHGILKKIADENQIKNIKLILAIFKMGAENTSKIAPILEKNNLNYIPEAHCYLLVNNRRLDITNANSDFEKIQGDIILEKEILPQQLDSYKVDFHKEYLTKWIDQENVQYDLESLWAIREECIRLLAE